jgi:uncharacterized protein (TIGR02246 family)
MKRILILLFVVGVGCLTLAQASNQDETEVRNLIPAFTDAWARADAPGLAALFASDGDLMIPTGNVFSGREAIGGFYASVFAQGYKGSKGAGDIVRLRVLQPDVMVGDGTWSITGAHKDGKEAVAERGVFTFVAVKREGKWRISALREQTSATRLNLSN